MSLSEFAFPITDWAWRLQCADNEACGNVAPVGNIPFIEDLSHRGGVVNPIAPFTNAAWKNDFPGGNASFNNSQDSYSLGMLQVPQLTQPFTIMFLGKRPTILLSPAPDFRTAVVWETELGTTQMFALKLDVGGGPVNSMSINAGVQLNTGSFGPAGVTEWIMTFDGVNSEIMSGGIVRASGNAGTNDWASGLVFDTFTLSSGALPATIPHWGRNEPGGAGRMMDFVAIDRLLLSREKETVSNHYKGMIQVINGDF